MKILNSHHRATINRETLLNESIIIKGFFEDGLVQEILQTIRSSYDCTVNQFVPYKFPEIDWNDTKKFEDMVSKFNATLANLLVKPFTSGINTYLNGITFQPASGLTPHSLLSAMTVRVLQPGKVEIHQHCENEMIPRCPDFYNLLGQYIEVWNQYSMVIMLNKPSKGGEIVIYEDKWVNAEAAETQRKKLYDLDMAGQNTGNSVGLDTGDLLIFRAGNTWHKVAQTYGAEPRITAGCFMGQSVKDPDQFLFWS